MRLKSFNDSHHTFLARSLDFGLDFIHSLPRDASNLQPLLNPPQTYRLYASDISKP